MRAATAEQMRRMDQIAIHERGIPSTLLMERAASGIVDAIHDRMEETKHTFRPTVSGSVISGGQTVTWTKRPEDPRQAVIFSGPGNNGGDGVAVAWLLKREGWSVRAFLVGKREKMTEDTREMERRLVEAHGALEQFIPGDPDQLASVAMADVLVDAIFGIGLNSDIRGDALHAIALMNRSAAPTVSADIPSGVETDTGRVLGMAVQADRTVTFTLPKAGHFVGKGGLCTGKLIVHDIGIPQDLIDGEEYAVTVIDRALVRSWLPERPADGHKGDFGKVYVLGGSVGYTGAPILASKAAVRSGAGLVFVGVPSSIYPIAAVKSDEAMPHPVPAGEDGTLAEEALVPILTKMAGCDAALVGPGLGRSPGVDTVVRNIMATVDYPLILDADGINALSGHIDVLDARRDCPTILTPHDGEFARLGGSLNHGGRILAAKEFALTHGCLLVLKGHCTIIALPDGEIFLNPTGNSGMAKGGSGDVLGGILLSLLGQGMHPVKAAAAAVWIHGTAGDRCARQLGERGMTPSDLIEALPEILKELEKV